MLLKIIFAVISVTIPFTKGFQLLPSGSKLQIVNKWFTQQSPKFLNKHLQTTQKTFTSVKMSHSDIKLNEPPQGLSAWLSLDTRGGVIVWSVVLIAIPTALYNILVLCGFDESSTGAYVGSIFVLLSCILWASTYVFRVATKDMTYAQQLRDYENAVLQKRLDELADDEIEALMEEIEVEDSKKRVEPDIDPLKL